MYLKQRQIAQIKEGIRELKELSTLETCGLDEDTKEKMRLWATWIGCYAVKIEDAFRDKTWD